MDLNKFKFLKKHFNLIIWVVFYFFFFSFLINNSLGYLDPDLGWHLRVGEQILSDKQIPHNELYNYTLEGETWVDHEWLLNIISFFIYENFGYIYLNIFFAFIVLLIIILLNLFLKKYFISIKKNNFSVMFWESFGLLAMSAHLGVRMQEFTILYLLLLLFAIYKFNIDKKIINLSALLPLFYFWASSHAGFLIGFVVLFLFLFVKITEFTLFKFYNFYSLDFKNIFKLKDFLWFSFFSFLAFLTIFFTLYGPELYYGLMEKSFVGGFYLSHISEWLPAWQWPIIYYQMFYLAISAIVLAFIFYYIFKNKNNKYSEFKIDLWNLAIFCFFFLLAFKSRRHFPLFFITSFPLFIQVVTRTIFLPEKMSSFLKNNYFLKLYSIISLFLISLFFILTSNFTTQPFQNKNYCKQYPCGAIKYLKNNNIPDSKIFNYYGWGGFMIWTYPEKKLFIDGRLPQHKYNKHTILEEYFSFFDEENTEKKIKEHNIELVLYRKFYDIKLNWFEKYFLGINENEINNKKDYLKEFLENYPNWNIIYEDDVSLLYQKNKDNLL